MPPKQTTAASRGRGSTSTSAAAGSSKSESTSSSSRVTQKPAKASRVAKPDLGDLDAFAEDAVEEEVRPPRQEQQQQHRQRRPRAEEEGAMDVDDDMAGVGDDVYDDDDDDAPETIPPDLLTRLLHEFFEREGTRISKDANAAVAKYMDIFVRETIARTAVEKESGFLEVEDLEKVAPQLLLDL